MEEDRISELPQHILQNHILSLLPQQNAIQTCLLSKSWRYLGLTLPKIQFRQSVFTANHNKFLSVFENSLQRYVDQKLSIQEFFLGMSESQYYGSLSLIKKWIPIVIMNMGVKTFNLTAYRFSLPSIVFQAELLEELYLEGCELNQIINRTVKLPVLKRLSLRFVPIEEKAFEKIISSCPSIEHLVLDSCKGLRSIKVNEARNLKHLDFYTYTGYFKTKKCTIEIDDAPSLETIRIQNCPKPYHLHNDYFYPRLKSLYLWNVHLPTESLINLSSNNCPCLEDLEIRNCSGLSEFKLSNCSIKSLIIDISDRPIKAAKIDAANIIYFELVSTYYLPSITFATTSREWKSRIEVFCSSGFKADVLSDWYLNLYEFLKALSQSQISLDTNYLPNLTIQDTYDGGIHEPVVVEHLNLREYSPSSELPALLNCCLFRICRPKYIGLNTLSANALNIYDESQLAESVLKTLVRKGETRKQDLEPSCVAQVENKLVEKLVHVSESSSVPLPTSYENVQESVLAGEACLDDQNPRSTHTQPFVSGAAKSQASWINCCGFLDVFRLSDQ